MHSWLTLLLIPHIIASGNLNISDTSFLSEPSRCMKKTDMGSLRFLEYSNGTQHPISIPFPSWSSVQVLAQISHILLTEVMNYSASFYHIDSIDDGVVVRSVLGCLDIDDLQCTKRNIDDPAVHLTLETWMTGNQLVSSMLESERPVITNALGYVGIESIFLWKNVVEDGLHSSDRIILSHYHAYNADLNKPAKFFDRWEKILELLPAELVLPCTAMNRDGDDFDTTQYKALTNDTQGGCGIHESVWFSPSCRANTTECVPILIQYYTSMISQLAHFHRLPLAVIRVARGQHDSREFYAAVQRSRCLFTYWTPNDRAVDRFGRAPEQLVLPRADLLEQAAGIYRTELPATQLIGYAWPGLARAAPQALILAARLTLLEQDMQHLMEMSSLRKRAAAPASDVFPAANSAVAFAVAREVACEWVRGNQARWAAWIPAACPPGAAPVPSLSACAACIAGHYCAGGYAPPVECPAGWYCPANATAPTLCPDGRGTPSPGAPSARSCTVCPAGSWGAVASDVCVPAAAVLSAVLLSLAVALGIAAAALRRWLRAAERAQWGVEAGDVIYCEPQEVLGRGPHAVTVKALRRGTPVAVKCFLLPPGTARAGSGKGGSVFGGSGRAMLGQSDSGGSSSAGATAAAGRASLDSRGSGGLSAFSSAHFRVGGLSGPLGSGGGHTQQAVLAGVRLLSGLRHPSIVAVMGAVTGPAGGGGGLRLVMELMELGSLADLLPNRMFRCGATFAARTLRAVARGMRFLHEAHPPVPHGALHAGNVLVDRHLCAKIADVALLRAPPPPIEADVYAFGAVAHELLARAPLGDGGGGGGGILPAEGMVNLDSTSAAQGWRPEPPAGCSVDMAALLGDCLSPRPADRPTFGEVDRRLQAIPPCRVCSHAVPAGAEDSDEEDAGSVLAAAAGRRQSFASAKSADCGGGDGKFKSRQRSSRVMANLFPAHVMAALVRGEKPAPEAKAMVTMFFSDIVGYTDLSATLSPGQVGDLLDRLFDRLDEAAEACGVSKIDTIGDAYLCVTNLAGDQPADHAARMARFAAAALRAASATPVDPEDLTRGSVRMRVGLHSGPCTAGVVGRRCPKYTLFGDTINVAARMEQSGEPGRIQCTAFTAGLIRAQDPGVLLVRRGTVEVKGKGAMETYWIEEVGESVEVTVTRDHASYDLHQARAAVQELSALIGASPAELGVTSEAMVSALPSFSQDADSHSRGCEDELPWKGRCSVGTLAQSFGGSSRKVHPAVQPDGPGADPA